MGVILRITGEELDIDNFDLGWNLEPSIKHRKGDLGRKEKPISSSQLIFNVSNADYSDLKEQIVDNLNIFNSVVGKMCGGKQPFQTHFLQGQTQQLPFK